jgi:hypothetical protein
MIMKITKSVTEIRSLCIKKDWFTNGTITQYERMFDRVRDGADIDEIATIIWVCSENATKEEIVKELLPVKNNRAEMVRAMELIARAVNDEDVFMTWLISGVADGDINESTTDEELDYYTEDENFADLMDTFLELMSRANQSGGLYADGIVSKAEE